MLKTEEEFDKFVSIFGGTKISDIVGSSPNFDNADYLFDDFNVIAELKCLEEDKIKDKRIQEKASALYNDILKQGKAPVVVFGTAQLSTEGFSDEFKEQIANLYKKPIQKRVIKANKQIRETKRKLKKDNHTGLLILVNDNNTALDPSHIMWVLAKIFQGKNYSSIEDILFFTVNLKSEHPSINKDLLVWVPIRRPGFDGCNDEFLEKLQVGWFSYLESRKGESIPTIYSDSKALMDNIKNI